MSGAAPLTATAEIFTKPLLAARRRAGTRSPPTRDTCMAALLARALEPVQDGATVAMDAAAAAAVAAISLQPPPQHPKPHTRDPNP
jgi:hypothetical protein